jgi:hypothetical protein
MYVYLVVIVLRVLPVLNVVLMLAAYMFFEFVVVGVQVSLSLCPSLPAFLPLLSRARSLSLFLSVCLSRFLSVFAVIVVQVSLTLTLAFSSRT